MAQTDVNRLLILPVIVLAAALSLSGCANLPFFGNDSDSSNNSSSKDDDDEEEEEEEEEEEPTNAGSCPQEFLDMTKADSAGVDTGFDDVSVTEIDPRLFEPAALGDIVGGCVFVIEYVQDGTPGTIFQAYIPGGADVVADIDTALVADGWDDTIDTMYVKNDNSYVIVYSTEDGGLTDAQIDEAGLSALGSDLVVVLAYKGEV